MGRLVEGWGIEEGTISVTEGVERDAVLREKDEVSVGGVVEERGGEEAARGGDESGGGTESAFRRDEFVGERVRERAREINGRVSVDVNVEKRIRGVVEEEGPEG